MTKFMRIMICDDTLWERDRRKKRKYFTRRSDRNETPFCLKIKLEKNIEYPEK